VIYEQRAPEASLDPAEQPDRAPWRPDETPLEAAAFRVDPGDRYVAIDRIDGPVVTLAVAPWPTVEPATGRLDFGPRGDRSTAAVPARDLQVRVDLGRVASDQLVRPLRPSDVFLVGGFTADPAEWTRVVDVTRAGRLAAKASLYSTAAPAPLADALPDYGIDRDVAQDRGPAEAAAAEPPDGIEPPPPGPVAYPAV
jgi:hypothetical protein